MATPFNGDYYDSNGDVRNIWQNGVSKGKSPKDYMSPFNGNFYASDGSVHNIDELFGGTMSGGGGNVPTGCIVMWTGTAATIPHGWALCDGTDGTPDLQNCFIVFGVGETTTSCSTGETDNITIIRYRQEGTEKAAYVLSYIIKL